MLCFGIVFNEDLTKVVGCCLFFGMCTLYCCCCQGLTPLAAWIHVVSACVTLAFYQDSDLLDRRKHCFTVQSESGEDLYFSVELDCDLAQWERAFQTATFLEVERIQVRVWDEVSVAPCENRRFTSCSRLNSVLCRKNAWIQ